MQPQLIKKARRIECNRYSDITHSKNLITGLICSINFYRDRSILLLSRVTDSLFLKVIIKALIYKEFKKDEITGIQSLPKFLLELSGTAINAWAITY